MPTIMSEPPLVINHVESSAPGFQIVQNETYYYCFEFTGMVCDLMDAKDAIIFKSRQDEEIEPMEGVFKGLGIG